MTGRPATAAHTRHYTHPAPLHRAHLDLRLGYKLRVRVALVRPELRGGESVEGERRELLGGGREPRHVRRERRAQEIDDDAREVDVHDDHDVEVPEHDQLLHAPAQHTARRGEGAGG